MGTTEKVQESAATSATSVPESAAIEPAKIEPAKIEPAKIEPAKIEPATMEAAAGEPAKPEPFRIGLTTATPRIEPSARPSASERADAPKLETPSPAEAASATSETSASARTRPGVSRFALLAASIAIAAAVGSLVGSLAASGIAHLLPAAAAPPPTATADARTTQQLSARISTEYSALKTNVDSLSRSANAQFAKLGERLDRAERAQAEPAAKLARIAEAVDRLEKHGAVAAPETTGSIAAPAAQAADAKTGDKPLEGWVLHDVKRGRALLESRYGGMFEVSQGGFLPGVGRIQEIKRQDGRWVIVTSRGTITSYY